MLSKKSNTFLQTAFSIKPKNLALHFNKMTLELTELIKDFIATKFLSKVELDFLESELWETLEHIEEITSLTSAPINISRELKLKEGSSWQLCCAVVLDYARPQEISRSKKLKKLIEKFSLQ